MKLLYYIPSIGNNNLSIKHEILLHNLNYIYDNIKQKFSISINFYTISEEIKESIKNLEFIENFYVYERVGGVLTELFLTNDESKTFIPLYDYILFVLDDVRIINLDIPKMIEIKEKYGIEFLSPKITNSTHWYMNSNSDTELTINNFLEIYLLLLKPADFNRFCSLYTIKNKWMWCIDLLFGYFNVKTGVIFKYTANHELPSNSNKSEACYLGDSYIRENTKYRDRAEIHRDYPPIKETIILE